MQAHTVKVPLQWAGINSDRAQIYLRDYFIHPLALPADPGAGEQVLRLTLNERLVSALAQGAGEKPAVALRWLLAAHIRELPAASFPVAAMASSRPRKAEVRAQTTVFPSGPFARPAWYTDAAAWDRLDPYAQQQMAAMKLGGGRRGLVQERPARQPWFARLVADPLYAMDLNDLYRRGDGVPKSCEQARVLLVAASRRGQVEATQRLRELNRYGCP